MRCLPSAIDEKPGRRSTINIARNQRATNLHANERYSRLTMRVPFRYRLLRVNLQILAQSTAVDQSVMPTAAFARIPIGLAMVHDCMTSKLTKYKMDKTTVDKPAIRRHFAPLIFRKLRRFANHVTTTKHVRIATTLVITDRVTKALCILAFAEMNIVTATMINTVTSPNVGTHEPTANDQKSQIIRRGLPTI